MDLREELFEDDLLSTVEAVMAHMDEPHGDASCVPMWIVSRAASREVKVVISGDGGDEAFGGYSVRYGQNLAIQRLRRWIPSLVRRGVAGPLSRLWPKGDRLPRSLRLKNVLENLSREFEDAYALDMSIFRPEMKKALYAREFAEQLGGFDARGLLRECFARTRDADPLSRLLYVDRHTYLSEGVIAKVDRMSMAHSLEVRSPLLDQEIAELASLIPARFKLAGGVGKTCLRQLARRRLPAEVVSARKAGFAPPLASWLRGPLQGLLRERVADPGSFVASVVDPAGVGRMLDEHARGARDWARPLWLLLVLETWARGARPGVRST
jgi:asparagine synthase (glutamine-hydrolysing)